MAVARTRKTRPRLLQCGRMPGFNYFVQVNVARVNRGLAQVDLPEDWRENPQKFMASVMASGG